jgi:superfamily II DNA/RNA helicase
MFEGVLDRLNKMDIDESEKGLFDSEVKAIGEIIELGKNIPTNGKMQALFPILKQCLPQMKRLKSPEKAIVFVNYRLTQKTLHSLLTEQGYNVLTYGGANSRDYSVMGRFRNDKDTQILIATDDMAKGLDI